MEGNAAAITAAAAEAAPAASATPSAAAPAAQPAASPFEAFKSYVPAGQDPAEFIRQTLEVRQKIDAVPGGLDRIIYDRAMQIAPNLAEELLRSPEGKGIAMKIAGIQDKVNEGEPLTHEEKRLAEMASRLEATEKRATSAEELAQQSQVSILSQQIGQSMEQEFQAAKREQPELEDWEPAIRRVISAEAKADPSTLEPGYVKRRSLELLAELTPMGQKSASRISTRGRATGSAGGGATRQLDPTTLSREEAAELMAAYMRGEA